jgi:L-iditol 2-dehydrogenase
MRAALYYNNRDIRIVEMPRPRTGPGELLMRVEACGICGSDVMEWYRTPKAPRVLGHEAVGVVEEIGHGVKAYSVGDHIFVSHHVPCNTCRRCLRGEHTTCETLHRTNIDPGGFAEYARVPSINVDRGVFKLPEEVSYIEGVLIEPLGCAVRGQRKLGMEPGDSVLIIGSGVAGILHIQLARLRGAQPILAADINEYRIKAAERFGADQAFDARGDLPESVREANDGRLTDRVIVCTSALEAIRTAISCVEEGGRILYFAPTPPGVELSLNFNVFWMRQLTLTTSYAAAPADLQVALELIRHRRIRARDMVTHKLPMEEIAEGFRLVERAGDSLKVIIEPHQQGS